MSRRLLALLFFVAVLPLLAQMQSQMPAVAPAKTPPAAAKAANATTIYLVCHAEKLSPTGDSELSEAGRKRAACLATTLADANLHSIYTTEFKRTKDTATPSAKQMNVTATVVPGADMEKLIAALQQETGHNVLVVGHSNTLPKIIERLGAGTVTIKDEEYDHLYIVTLVNGQASLASLRYCL